VTNVFASVPWGKRGGSGTLGGHFFRLFFGAGSGSEPVPGMASPGRGRAGGRGGGRTSDRGWDGCLHRSLRSIIVVTRSISGSRRSARALLAGSWRILWHKDTMELARTSPSQSPRPLDPADRVRRSLRTPFELRACSKPDRLGLRPRSSELRSLPLELRSSSMMCARRSPAEQDLAAYRKKIPGFASTNFHTPAEIFRVFDPKFRVSEGPLTPKTAFRRPL